MAPETDTQENIYIAYLPCCDFLRCTTVLAGHICLDEEGTPTPAFSEDETPYVRLEWVRSSAILTSSVVRRRQS